MHTILVLVAPSVFAASIYMCLGRIVFITNGEKYSLVSPRWLTRVFVVGDVVSFVMQGAGKFIPSCCLRPVLDLTRLNYRRRCHGQRHAFGFDYGREHHHSRALGSNLVLLMLCCSKCCLSLQNAQAPYTSGSPAHVSLASQSLLLVSGKYIDMDPLRFSTHRICLGKCRLSDLP